MLDISSMYRVLVLTNLKGKQFYNNERKDYYYDVYKNQKTIE